MKRILALTLAVLMIVACFAGCGKAKDDDVVTNPTGGDTQQKVITVGYTIYEPMNYKDANGKLVGYDTELAEKVFGNLGYQVIFQEIVCNALFFCFSAIEIDS